jgi:hypothetical protein
VLGKARVCGRAPAPGATGTAVGGPLFCGDAETEVTELLAAMLLGGLEDGCGTGVVASTCAAGGGLAPQPAIKAAVMTAAAALARRDGFMPSPAGAGREGSHPSIMPDRPG